MADQQDRERTRPVQRGAVTEAGMSWVRIHDGAMSHPKIIGLSDKAFRLWIWGLSYCQQHLTDGFIPAIALGAGLSRTATLLVSARLWDAREDGGYQIHDYLDWNNSKEFVAKKRGEAKARMSDVRSRTGPKSVRSRTHPSDVPIGLVDLGSFSERESEGKPDLGVQAARFCERFVELYQHHRNGAHYHLKPSLDWTRVCDLLRTWDAARLEKLAVILLTTDDEWIAKTDRGIGVFVSRASWCDDRLKAWEVEQQGQKATV